MVSNGTWAYNITGEFTPGENTNELEAIYLLRGDVAMKVSSSRPDFEQKPVGVGVDFVLGEYSLTCSKDEKPVMVDFTVKKTTMYAWCRITCPSTNWSSDWCSEQATP